MIYHCFNVLVKLDSIEDLGQQIDDKLAPYCEDTLSIPKEDLLWIDMEDKLHIDYNREEPLCNNWMKVQKPNDYGKRPNEAWGIFEDYVREYHHMEKDEETNRYGFWKNPDGRWSEYSMVTDPDDMFVSKRKKQASIMQIKNISFRALEKIAAKKAISCYDILSNKSLWDVDSIKFIQKYLTNTDLAETWAKDFNMSRSDFLSKYLWAFDFHTISVLDEEWKDIDGHDWIKNYKKSFLLNENPERYVILIRCRA